MNEKDVATQAMDDFEETEIEGNHSVQTSDESPKHQVEEDDVLGLDAEDDVLIEDFDD